MFSQPDKSSELIRLSSGEHDSTCYERVVQTHAPLHVGICTNLGVHPHHVRAHFALTNGGVVGPLRHLEGVCGGVEEGGCLGCVFKKGGALLSAPHITSVFHTTCLVLLYLWPIYQTRVRVRAAHATSVCLSNLSEMQRRTTEREEKERG